MCASGRPKCNGCRCRAPVGDDRCRCCGARAPLPLACAACGSPVILKTGLLTTRGFVHDGCAVLTVSTDRSTGPIEAFREFCRLADLGHEGTVIHPSDFPGGRGACAARPVRWRLAICVADGGEPGTVAAFFSDSLRLWVRTVGPFPGGDFRELTEFPLGDAEWFDVLRATMELDASDGYLE